MSDTTKLILQYEGLSEAIKKLYGQLASSDAIREVFLKDPVGVVVNSLSPQGVNVQDSVINLSNMLLFALLSNKRFIVWAQDYGEKAREEVATKHPGLSAKELNKLLIVAFDRQRVLRDLSEAMLTFIDASILHALILYSHHKINERETQAATVAQRGFVLPPSAESLVVDNVAIARNALAVQNVLLVFNHVRVAGIEDEKVFPDITRQNLEVITRLFADQMFTRAIELRDKRLLGSLEAFEKGVS